MPEQELIDEIDSFFKSAIKKCEQALGEDNLKLALSWLDMMDKAEIIYEKKLGKFIEAEAKCLNTK